MGLAVVGASVIALSLLVYLVLLVRTVREARTGQRSSRTLRAVVAAFGGLMAGAAILGLATEFAPAATVSLPVLVVGAAIIAWAMRSS